MHSSQDSFACSSLLSGILTRKSYLSQQPQIPVFASSILASLPSSALPSCTISQKVSPEEIQGEHTVLACVSLSPGDRSPLLCSSFIALMFRELVQVIYSFRV